MYAASGKGALGWTRYARDDAQSEWALLGKRFFRDARMFKPLAVGFGSCIATDRITVDGLPVGYMYREAADDDLDSGWRFFAGDEDDGYANDARNLQLYDVNTIANYDPCILPLLDAPAGSAFIRQGDRLVPDHG